MTPDGGSWWLLWSFSAPGPYGALSAHLSSGISAYLQTGLRPWLPSLPSSPSQLAAYLPSNSTCPENVFAFPHAPGSKTPISALCLSGSPCTSSLCPCPRPLPTAGGPPLPPIACELALPTSRAPAPVQACGASGSVCHRGSLPEASHVCQTRGQRHSILCFCLARDRFQGLSVMVRVVEAPWRKGIQT